MIEFLMCKNVRFEVHNKTSISIGPRTPSPPPKKNGLKLINVLFTVLHAQGLDQTILRSTQQQQSLPLATTILLTERGMTPTI